MTNAYVVSLTLRPRFDLVCPLVFDPNCDCFELLFTRRNPSLIDLRRPGDICCKFTLNAFSFYTKH